MENHNTRIRCSRNDDRVTHRLRLKRKELETDQNYNLHCKTLNTSVQYSSECHTKPETLINKTPFGRWYILKTDGTLTVWHFFEFDLNTLRFTYLFNDRSEVNRIERFESTVFLHLPKSTDITQPRPRKWPNTLDYYV